MVVGLLTLIFKSYNDTHHHCYQRYLYTRHENRTIGYRVFIVIYRVCVILRLIYSAAEGTEKERAESGCIQNDLPRADATCTLHRMNGGWLCEYWNGWRRNVVPQGQNCRTHVCPRGPTLPTARRKAR